MNITFIDQNIVNQVLLAWNSARYVAPYRTEGSRSPAELAPTAEEWGYILNLAFAASLQTDEARPTTFRIGFERDVEPPNYGTIGLPDQTEFLEPLNATVAELVKLAHATSGTDSLIWIRRLQQTQQYVISGV